MKKSKLYVISSLAVAMITSLVLGLVFLNVTKNQTKTVSAETENTYTIYFYNTQLDNKANWSDGDICVHMWGGGTDSWPMMTRIGSTHWHKLTVTTAHTTFQFKANNWDGNKGNAYSYPTYSLSSNMDNVYYVVSWNGGDSDSRVTASKKLTVTDYIDNENVTDISTFASGSSRTVYYYNKDKWTNVYAHSWSTENSIFTTKWPGVAMEAIGDGWYSAEIDNVYGYVKFNDGSNQTSQLTINNSNPYYSDNWYAERSIGLTDPDDSVYYIVGYLNGKIGWYASEDSKPVDGEVTGTNQAQVKTFLQAGDIIKVKKGSSWYGGQTANNESGAVSVSEEGGNVTINTTGLYTIYVNDQEKLWLSKNEVVLQETKSKLSNDGNYLLLMTGFDLSSLGDNTDGVNIGYSIVKNSESADTSSMGTEYYTNVLVLTESGSALVDSTVLYGSDAYKLIVYEISGCEAGDSFSVTAQITYNGTVVASGTTVTGTVPAE